LSKSKTSKTDAPTIAPTTSRGKTSKVGKIKTSKNGKSNIVIQM